MASKDYKSPDESSKELQPANQGTISEDCQAQSKGLITGVVLSETITTDCELFLKELGQDPELEKCHDFAIRNTDGYYFKNDLLYWRYLLQGSHPSWEHKTQLVPPGIYQKEIFKMAHESPTGGHLGRC